MPLEGDKKRKYQREWVRQRRTKNVEPQTPDVVEPEMFEGKPRYLELSDGQVLDRANLPKPDLTKLSSFMLAQLRALAGFKGFIPLASRETQKNLLKKHK